MIEIVIVMTLIGIFILMTANFMQQGQLDDAKADRLGNAVYNTIRTANQDMIIGRGVIVSGKTTTVVERDVRLTGSTITTEYTTTGGPPLVLENILKKPFFDNDPGYVIKNMAASPDPVSNTGVLPTNWSLTGMTDLTIQIKNGGTIQIKNGANIVSPTPRTVLIQVGYGAVSRTILLDTLVGTVDLRNNGLR